MELYKQSNMTPKNYQDNFFNSHLKASISSAKEIIPVILKYIKPTSVIDVGCGVGTWLSIWEKFGVKEILGIDGNYVRTEELLIDVEKFIADDLEKGFQTNRQFDLACCLEVAEHIKPENAENFILSICNLSDVVLFSAAIPGQEGTLHYNEQYPEFWIKLFAKQDFKAFDCLREQVWNNDKISWWYRQNIMFFVRNKTKEKYPSITKDQRPVLSLVHPELFKYKCEKADNYEKILQNPFTILRHFTLKYIYKIKNFLKK